MADEVGLRAVGANSKAAKYAGISPKKLIIIGIIISGGLAGLGGGLNMLGYQSRWVSGTVLGYGFDASMSRGMDSFGFHFPE